MKTLISNLAFLLPTLLAFVCIVKWFLQRSNRHAQYFYVTLLMIALALIQGYFLIQNEVHTAPLSFLLLHFPTEIVGMAYFFSFISQYLPHRHKYQVYERILFSVFWLLLGIVLLLMVSLATPYFQLIKEWAIHWAIYRNIIAAIFYPIAGIFMYQVIRQFEAAKAHLAFRQVAAQTQWLKSFITVLIVISLIWILIALFTREAPQQTRQLSLYLYIIVITTYILFALAIGMLRWCKVQRTTQAMTDTYTTQLQRFQLSGIHHLFEQEDIQYIEAHPAETTSILSYFATSLFDKHVLDEVLWDVVENCIAQLQLEDCVIYMVDEERNILVQKATYGNKQKAYREILDPIEIPIGKGIVGKVAADGEPVCLDDISQYPDYIVDDIPRASELTVPILDKKKVIGVLDTEHSQKGFFTSQHLFIFKLIARLLEKKLVHLREKKEQPITDDNQYLKYLHQLIEEEKIYRDPQLNLNGVAEQLGISGNYLSQLLNKVVQKKFADYINAFRVAEAKRMLEDPQYTDYTIVAIGLEAGFNSKSTFYKAFKEHTGLSPKTYLASSSEV